MNESDVKLEDTQNRLAAIGQISAGIAHEIRNPLTAVKGFLQLMQKDYNSAYWQIVNSELDLAISTVQNLLTVSKPELGDETTDLINLCVLIESTLSIFQNEMYRVKVEKRFYNTAVLINGKRNQIKRAIFNLLKNAFEAIEGDGVITIEHYRKDDLVYLIIRDSGKGIPADKLELLGKPFFTTKSENGTGLGLAQVYATIDEHGANVKVDSKEGEWTEFAISFPIASYNAEVRDIMNLTFSSDMDIRTFFDANIDSFNLGLEAEAKATFEAVEKSKFVNRQDLIDHANQIVSLVHDGLTQEIIQLAQQRGIAWAKSDVPIITKMEWFYSLRKVIWSFLRYYHTRTNISANEVFELSERISDALDNFIIHFNVSFIKFRDDILKSQKAIIDELHVPLIPILNQIAVVPLIGTLDEERIHKIEDKLLDEVDKRDILKIFIDVSAAEIVHPEIVPHLTRLIDGIALLGCKATLTGVNAKLAKMMLDSRDYSLRTIPIESTLQQALAKESSMQ